MEGFAKLSRKLSLETGTHNNLWELRPSKCCWTIYTEATLILHEIHISESGAPGVVSAAVSQASQSV